MNFSILVHNGETMTVLGGYLGHHFAGLQQPWIGLLAQNRMLFCCSLLQFLQL